MEKKFNQLIENFKEIPGFSVKSDTNKEGTRTVVFYNRPVEEVLSTKEKIRELFATQKQEEADYKILKIVRKYSYDYIYLIYNKKKNCIIKKHYLYALGFNSKTKTAFPKISFYTQSVYNKKNLYYIATKIEGGRVKNAGKAFPAMLNDCFFVSNDTKVFTRTVLGIKEWADKMTYHYMPQMWAKKWEDSPSIWEPIEEKFKTKIPKRLKNYSPREVFNILEVIKDKNQLNWLCQQAKKADKEQNLSNIIAKNAVAKADLRDPYYYDSMLIDDWIRMAQKLGRKINLNLSMKRIDQQHDEFDQDLKSERMPEIKVHETFKKLNPAEAPFTMSLIDSKEKLLAESTKQKHCVATYAEKINNGGCAILSIEYEGKPYTLEVVPEYNSTLDSPTIIGVKMRQLKGFRNINPPEELVNKVQHWINNQKL